MKVQPHEAAAEGCPRAARRAAPGQNVWRMPTAKVLPVRRFVNLSFT